MSFNLNLHLPFRIAVLSNYIKQVTSDRFVKSTDITGRDWRVLAIVGLQGPITPARIAEITGLDRVTITRSIKQLEQLSYVSKEKNQNDGRSLIIKLTAQGDKKYSALLPLMERNGQEYRNLLTDGEFQILLELLSKLQNHAIHQLNQTNI